MKVDAYQVVVFEDLAPMEMDRSRGMCLSCGRLVPKTLSDHSYTCLHCGLVMDRDRNTAINILHRGLQTLQI